KFVDKLYDVNIAELKIVETFADQSIINDDYDLESEDTVSILTRYVDDFDNTINKSSIKKLISQIYKQACEVV
ncbi:recombinase, partial [archaeon]|nr:recombinase [archaeon]